MQVFFDVYQEWRGKFCAVFIYICIYVIVNPKIIYYICNADGLFLLSTQSGYTTKVFFVISI